MAGEPQPLFNNQPITNDDGTPTQYFIRWAQQRQIDISGGLTSEQAQALLNDFAGSHSVKAGTGLVGGGPLSANPELDLFAGLANLYDIDLTTAPTDGQALLFSSTAKKWVPGTVSGGGGPTPVADQPLFSISASHESSPVALPNNAFSTIALDTIAIDTANGWNAASNTYILPKSGTYLITSKLRIVDGAPPFISYGQGVDKANQDSAAFQWFTSSNATTYRRNGSLNLRLYSGAAGDAMRLFSYLDYSSALSWIAAEMNIIGIRTT